MKTKNNPVLEISESRLQKKALNIINAFDFADVYYAIKANASSQIITSLKKIVYGFEIASQGELNMLRWQNINMERVITSNPIKSVEFIARSVSKGVKIFVVDSIEELEKFKKYKDKAEIFIRFKPNSSNSSYSLSKKFGMSTDEATKLIEYGLSKGYKVKGLNFHVGSQNVNPEDWSASLKLSSDIFKSFNSTKIYLDSLNLGGGIPADYNSPKDLNSLSKTIKLSLDKYFNKKLKQIIMEPGRAIVADSGRLITTVIGIATRGGKTFVTLDTGIFNGLMEIHQGFDLPISVLDSKSTQQKKYTLVGPSCDSMDVIYEDKMLPELELGRKVVFESAGAYTTAYASNFNGFEVPITALVD